MGARTKAWQAFTLESSFCKRETENVAVFPVPDCACAMTSDPAINVSKCDNDIGYSSENTFDDWHDSTLLDSRWALETIGIDTWEKSVAQGNSNVGASCVV